VTDQLPASPSFLFSAAARSNGRKSSRLISVRLPDDLLQRLAEVGNAEGLSLSDTLRLVLERGLGQRGGKKSEEKKKRKD
jgi:metal-responsive CopG/Arc/MetJ family transcriptional regulator